MDLTARGVTHTLNADNGRYCRPTVIEPFSDPRLQGEILDWDNRDCHMHGHAVVYSGFTIRDDDGAWQQIPG